MEIVCRLFGEAVSNDKTMKPLVASPLPAAVACLATLSGCSGDALVTGSFAPAYITMSGTVLGSTSAGRVDLALLWQNGVGADQPANVVQVGRLDTGVGDYQFAVTMLPPAQATHVTTASDAMVYGVPAGVQWDIGLLIAYHDGNGDHTLTMVDPGGQPSEDTVLALSAYDLFYDLGGPLTTAYPDALPMAKGFTLTSRNVYRNPNPGECDRFDDSGHFRDICGPKVVTLGELMVNGPAGTPIDLDLSASQKDPYNANDLNPAARMQGFTCNTFLGMQDYPDYAFADDTQICDGCRFCKGYDCPPDRPPSGVAVTCAADLRSYVYVQPVDMPQLCGSAFYHYGHDALGPDEAVPADWPCH